VSTFGKDPHRHCIAGPDRCLRRSGREDLDIAVGQPILVMRQVIVDSAGKPLLSSTVQYVGDRYRLRTSFSRSRKTGR